MSSALMDTHGDLISRARAAFGSDPSYAIVMARQATVSRSRKAPRNAPLLASDDPEED